MRTAYRVLAYAIAVEVAVQAMAVVWAVAGLGKWIMSGGVADASMMQSEATPFPEVAGFMIHGINGMIVVPVLALVLMVLWFFTRHRRAIVVAVGLSCWWCCRASSASSATSCRPSAPCTV